MTRELIIVRHGETVQNVAGIAQGWRDSELSAAGRLQVERLAERLARLNPTALYSSPLGRALATAEAIRARTGLEIVLVDDLREMNYGEWEGRSFLDVRREYEEQYQRWITEGEAACPSGESHADVRLRLERAFASIANGGAAEPMRAIVVTHGNAIRIAATALLDLPLMSARYFAQDNAALNLFVHRPHGWILKHWNDTTHCPER